MAGNYQQINLLYLNDGDADPFSSGGTAIGTSVDRTTAVALQDVDKDGDLDVVVGHEADFAGDDGENKVYLNDGDADPFSAPISSVDVGSGDSDNARAVIVEDIDRDGDWDVVVGNTNGQANKLYMNGVGIFDTSSYRAGSIEVDDEAVNISEILLESTESTPNNTYIDYYLSNNGGSKWYSVKPDASFVFPTTGTDLRWRAKLHSLSPILTPEIDELMLSSLSTPPQVTNINSVTDTGDGSVLEGEQVGVSITQLLVTFDQDVVDPAGDGDANDVTNPANYLLYEAGANDSFDTVDCSGGIQSDDVGVTVNSVSYDSGTFTSTLNINGGSALLGGDYQLLVCGTTSIENSAGQKLDGDGDGMGGDDFVRNFSILDADGDGIPNDEDPDDDNDGMTDVFENMHGLDPFDPSDANTDLDGDGLTNLEEFEAGTNPNDPDSDGDGIADGFDEEPAVASNLCVGPDAIFSSTHISNGTIGVCADGSSVTVESSVTVDSGGTVKLWAPVVRFDTGFGIPSGAEVQIKSFDPSPPAE